MDNEQETKDSANGSAGVEITSEIDIIDLMSKWDDMPKETAEETEDETPDTDALKERIETLESDNKSLEADNETLVLEIDDRDEKEATEADFQELDDVADQVLKVATIDKEIVKNTLLGLFVTDESFREAWGNKDENPVAWEIALDQVSATFPTRANRALGAAVRAARTAEGRMDASGYDHVNWGKLSDAEFAVAKQDVFNDAMSGKLKPESPSGGGHFSTS